METMHQKWISVGHAIVFRDSHGETNYRTQGDNYRIQGDVLIRSTLGFKENAINISQIEW